MFHLWIVNHFANHMPSYYFLWSLLPLSLNIKSSYYFISFSNSSLLPLLCPPLCILIFSLWVHYLPLRSFFLKWMIILILVMITITTTKNVGWYGILSEQWESYKWKYTGSWLSKCVELYLFLSLEVSISILLQFSSLLLENK